jgi:hypothetical protein
VSDDIKPALTTEEWVAKRVDLGHGTHADTQDCTGLGYYLDGGPVYAIGYEGCDRDEPVERPHALAAFCLYGQPYGFSHEDVAKLRAMPDNPGPDYTGYASIDDGAWFASLIARITALLPPSEPDGTT